MALTIGVPKESSRGERRVALVPEIVRKLTTAGYAVLVEEGAGERAFFSNDDFQSAGARLSDRDTALRADLVVKVQPPSVAEISSLKEDAAYVGFLSPLDQPELSRRLADRKVTALSMELVPRISRAQKMDALSAMSSVGGYKAALLAATTLPKFFPLLTTAAGTVRPASVLVLGAGVAGLQAIATSRRLGARVAAYDIREAVREEVQSLGAQFVELEVETQSAEDTGGYARELEAEKARRQTELLVQHIGKSDVVISTALIPGRPAPILITEEAVSTMKPGSVIVDMAAANGGNCVFTEPDRSVERFGVTILGPTNLPAEAPIDASAMYSRTVFATISEFTTAESFNPNFDDEIFRGACVTHAGEIVNDRVRDLLSKSSSAGHSL